MFKTLSRCTVLLTLTCAGCHLVFPFDVAGLDASGDAAARDGSDAGQVPTLVLTGEESMVGVQSTTIAVDVQLGHAFVLCSFRTAGSEAFHVSTCQLGPAGLTITSGNAASEAIVRWHVVQMASARTERGHTRFEIADTLKPVTIKAVDRSKTFVLVTSRMDYEGRFKDEQRLVSARLKGTTTLELARGEPGEVVDVEWQVV